MTRSYRNRVGEIDQHNAGIDFSPEVRAAFRDMAAALHFSDKISPELLSIIQDWGETARPSVHSVLIALPPIAQEVLASGNAKAKKAWGDMSDAMFNYGFSLEGNPRRSSGRE